MNLKKLPKSYIILVGAFIIVSAIVLASPWYFPIGRNAIVPWATVALAFAAFLTILYSNEQEKRRREEERRIREEERERDFKRRCLKDIQDWAEKGINVLLSCPVVPVDPSEARQIRPYLKALSALNKWVMDASRIFAADDKKALLKKVDEAAENLKQYCEVLEGKLAIEGMAQRHNNCITLFTEVLERIADLKVKLQL